MFPRYVQIGPYSGDVQQVGVLRDVPVAKLGEAELHLHHREHMLDPHPDHRLGPVLLSLNLIDGAPTPTVPIREVLDRWSVDGQQLFLAPMGLVAEDPSLLAMQQARQHPGVVDIGCGCLRAPFNPKYHWFLCGIPPNPRVQLHLHHQ